MRGRGRAGLAIVVLTASALVSAACGETKADTAAATGGDAAAEAAPTASDGSGSAETGTGAEAGATYAGGYVEVPLVVTSHSGADRGKFLMAQVSINGSPPIGVLLDTGSVGLRVFKSALGGTTVATTSKTTEADFGGNVMAGHVAEAAVTFGDGATSATSDAKTPIAVLETFSCSMPGCDLEDGTAAAYENEGIHGILGIALRKDDDGLVSPIAMLPAPLSDGFSIRGARFEPARKNEARLLLGIGPDFPDKSLVPIQLAARGKLPTGAQAWADDEIELCYELDSAATDPACSAGTFDTGSNYDVLYAKNVSPEKVTDGVLAPGEHLEIKVGTTAWWGFTVGDPIAASWDGVFVQADEAFTIVGIEVFFRYDEIRFDLAKGQIWMFSDDSGGSGDVDAN